MARAQRALQAPDAPPQQPQRDLDAAPREDQLGLPGSPYLTLPEVAAYCRFDHCADPVRACRKWLRRKAIRIGDRGLIDRAIIETLMHTPKGRW